MIREIGWVVSLVLALTAYCIWMAGAMQQITFFAEKPSSFVGQWLQASAGVCFFIGGLIVIVGLLLLVWKPWE